VRGITIESGIHGAAAEAEIVERFRRRLLMFAARRLGDPVAAEDVAQETLRRVIEALRNGRIEKPDALPAFVFQTAKHVCQFRHRSRQRGDRALHRLTHEGREPVQDPLSALVGSERRTEVRNAVERLGVGDRELLRMLYYGDRGTVEAAAELKTNPGALRVRKHRALQRLAALLTAVTNPADWEPSG